MSGSSIFEPVVPAAVMPVSRFYQSEFLRYFLVSALALAVDAGGLFLLVGHAGWHYLPAAMLCFTVGSLVAFALSSAWAFRKKSFKRWHDGFLVFSLIGLLGLAVNLTVLWLAVESLGLYYMLAKVAAAACSFVFNFLLRKLTLFS